MDLLLIFAASLITIVVAGLLLAAKFLRSDNKQQLFVLVPLLLAFAAGSYFTINGVMGLPARIMPEEVMMIEYRTNGALIWIWAIPKGDITPRTYVFPYTKETHKELQQAQERNKHGGSSILKNNYGTDSGDGGSSAIPFTQHSFNPLKSLRPKE